MLIDCKKLISVIFSIITSTYLFEYFTVIIFIGKIYNNTNNQYCVYNFLICAYWLHMSSQDQGRQAERGPK